MLSSRELAILFWGSLLLFWLASKKEFRKSLASLVRVLLHKTILLVTGAAICWMILLVKILAVNGLWRAIDTKVTIEWFVLSAFVMMVNAKEFEGSASKFFQAIKDSFSLAVVLGFVADTYTFPFFVEAALVPVISIVVLVNAVSLNDEERKPVEKLTTVLLAIFGSLFLLNSGMKIWDEPDKFFEIGTFNSFLLPIFFTLWFLPFLFLLTVYMSYETHFRLLAFKIDDARLRRFTKRKLLQSFGLNIVLLRRWYRDYPPYTGSTKQEILQSIDRAKEVYLKSKYPSVVQYEDGWAAYSARQFLNQYSLNVGDYHELYSDFWSASSDYLNLVGSGILGNNISYYLEGTEEAVKRLILKLNINDLGYEEDALQIFQDVMVELLTEAANLSKEDGDITLDADSDELVLHGRGIKLEKEPYLDFEKGYSLKLVIDHVSGYRSDID